MAMTRHQRADDPDPVRLRAGSGVLLTHDTSVRGTRTAGILRGVPALAQGRAGPSGWSESEGWTWI